MGSMKETLGFQTEVKQLLSLMINSLYSNKEIFLRELVSNASDACDKLRFEAIDNDSLYEDDAELKIKVTFDKEARTITISDNGIGLNRQDAIEHLGTIAKSGTKEFFSRLSGDQQKDAALIGQFGVGFYSAFIVAEEVTVRSRRAGESAKNGVEWKSKGDGEFSVEAIEKQGHGTDIILHLKEGEDELLAGWKLKSILTKYSDHISLPILMVKEKWDEEKSEMIATDEWETVNKASALWARPKSEVTEEEYKEFYKTIAFDFQDPLAYTHNRVEGGRTEYTSLLYIPAKAPFDIWDRGQQKGIKLYVKRVFIMDDAEQLMPPYLRFVKGVVDSADLPLNVSREILQESRDIRSIREGSVKKVLGMLEDIAKNEPEKYQSFWDEFGQVLKEGVGDDFNNKERIAQLLRFATTHTEAKGQTVSLSEYVARMKEGQDKIYYLTADTFSAALYSPHLEVFKKKGVEVLLLADRVDEWMVNHLTEFDGKQLQSCAKGDLDLGELEDEKDKEEKKQVEDEFKDVLEKVQTLLADQIKEARVTLRLTDSPSCVVADEQGMSEHLKRMLKQAGQAAPDSKPILELNPKHPLVERLRTDDSNFDELVYVLFNQAQLAEGGHLDDPSSFVKRLNKLLLQSVSS